MLENAGENRALSGKRYVPPNQRNHPKSGDPSQFTTPRSVSDSESTFQFHPQFVTLDGCSSSDAFRLLRQRWEAAIDASRDPSSMGLRPVMYTGTSMVELPHQIMSTTQNQMDFLLQLGRSVDEKREQD